MFYLNEVVDGSVMTLKRYWILDNLNLDFKGRLLNKTDHLKWLITSGNGAWHFASFVKSWVKRTVFSD